MSSKQAITTLDCVLLNGEGGRNLLINLKPAAYLNMTYGNVLFIEQYCTRLLQKKLPTRIFKNIMAILFAVLAGALGGGGISCL